MEHLIIDLFSPILLIVFILGGFAIMTGSGPESLVKPFFSLLGVLLNAAFNLFIVGLKLVMRLRASRTAYSNQNLSFPNNKMPRGRNDNDPGIKIVVSD